MHQKHAPPVFAYRHDEVGPAAIGGCVYRGTAIPGLVGAYVFADLSGILFAIGVGDLIVGTTDFADFPEAARGLPRVARAHSVDLVRVSAARPDLILVWGSGFPPATVDAVRRLGVPTFVSEPARLADNATSLEGLER